MISLKDCRKNPQETQRRLDLKGATVKVESMLDLDSSVRELKTISNDLRAERNSASEAIGLAKRSGKDATDAIVKTRELGDELKAIEIQLSEKETELNQLLIGIPNLPSETVPEGKDEKGNVEIRTWGGKPSFDFDPMDHMTLGEKNSLFDFQRGAKISGSGFPLYSGAGAKLERALINAMIDHHVDSYQFKELFPSVLMRKESMETTGQLPKFEEDMYHTEVDNLYLAPTAEVPVTNVHRDEIISEDELPIQYVAYSPCFRRESGSYGKDTRGLLRVHQFNKVELVKFVTPESSYEEHETLTSQAEGILQLLELPYRVLNLCTGDLGFSAAKCYDLEVWAPGEHRWLEVSSCSNFESFQARRGHIRYRRSSDRKVDFLHTLNGSGLATPRLMVALLENHQQEDGSISIPEPLQPYFGSSEIRP